MSTADAFEHAIRRVVTEEVARIAEEEAAAADKRVRERIARLMDELALRVLSHYQIERPAQHIVITVKKPS